MEAPTIEGDAAIEHLLADERAALYLGVHLCRLLQLSRRDNSVVAEIASAGIVAEAGALLNAHPALHSVVQEWFTAIGGQAAEPADLTAQEAAEALGLLGRDGKPTDTFYRLAADKEKLAGYQVGKQWRIPTAHLRAFKQQRSKR